MSLVISRRASESFVLIDDKSPEVVTLVTISNVCGGKVSIRINSPDHVRILRREILHRCDVAPESLDEIARMEARHAS